MPGTICGLTATVLLLKELAKCLSRQTFLLAQKLIALWFL